MADSAGPTGGLPIQIVTPGQGDHRPNQAGGSTKPLSEVDAKFRGVLTTQLKAVEAEIVEDLETLGVAPMRVTLIPKAYAKSHRPKRLFSDESCPIVGAGRMGELFIKATPRGLHRLHTMIEGGSTKGMIKDLSTVQAIEPVTPEWRRKERSSRDVQEDSPVVDDDLFMTRVRLFELGDEHDDQLNEAFLKTCRERSLPVTRSGYGGEQIYAVGCRSEGDIEALSGLISVRSVIGMPMLRTIRSQVFNKTEAPPDLPGPADVEGDYPVVVVVDSGITETTPALSGWVVGRDEDVAANELNPTHGTFVAGLIVHGNQLNPHLPDVTDAPCAVYDVQMIPNHDASYGDVGALLEHDFLESLERSLKKHASKHQVWNLSLSSSEVCSNDDFSALAARLDDFQEEYGVTFVIAAGNYDDGPLLDYPREGEQLEEGRITAPADSVLGVAVGAISHLDYQDRGPGQNEASPFSRHGAGPNHIIKPDLVHYGGTCTVDGTIANGVRSITETGCGEDIGTSFAAPLVSRALAHIHHQVEPSPNPVLARALLTHHARDPRDGGRVPDDEVNFLGFGRPSAPPYCLECSPHETTLIFSDEITPGYYLEWDDFPYPASLRKDGRYFGQIALTVAYAPIRGERWGSEYCETNIKAQFGRYAPDSSRKSGEGFKTIAGPEHQGSTPGAQYESKQVSAGRKWAPVRTYFGDLRKKGMKATRWGLRVSVQSRHDDEEHRERQSQPFALVLTISDPKGEAPVYDEMARLLRSRWKVENLSLRVGARIRAQS